MQCSRGNSWWMDQYTAQSSYHKKRNNSYIVCLSDNQCNRKCTAPSGKYSCPPPPKKKKINIEADQASRSVLFNRIFCGYRNVLYLHRTVDTRYLWLFSIWNTANATKELNFQFSFILIHFNSHSRLVAAIMDSAILDLSTGLKEIDIHGEEYHGDKIS